jgi:hypothetical protein
MNIESYHLSASDVETSKEVLDWNDVAPTRSFQAGDMIVEGDARWQVIGVRKTSTAKLLLIHLRGDS